MRIVERHRPTLRRRIPSDTDLARGAQDRVVRVEQAETVTTGGSHTFFKGVRADNGQAVFIKHNKIENLWPKPFAVLNPTVSAAREQVFPHLDRLQDMSETMLSHFMKSWYERRGEPYSGVAYQEVVFQNPRNAQPMIGIAAPLVPHLGSLEDASISNPRQAMEMSIMRGMLFGDYDVTFHDGNISVVKADGRMSDGTPLRAGQSLSMDFGEAGNIGLGYFGVPYANNALLRQYPDLVAPAVDRILATDAAEVKSLVEAGGEHVTGWNSELTDHYTSVIRTNLERFRQRMGNDPGWLDPTRSHNPLRGERGGLARRTLLAAVAAPINYTRIKMSGILDTVPSTEHVAAVLFKAMSPYPSAVSKFVPVTEAPRELSGNPRQTQGDARMP